MTTAAQLPMLPRRTLLDELSTAGFAAEPITLPFGLVAPLRVVLAAVAEAEVPGLRLEPVRWSRNAFAVYCATGLQGMTAFKDGSFKRFLPPLYGGDPIVVKGPVSQNRRAQSVQAFLNTNELGPRPARALVTDGVFGAASSTALLAWKRVHAVGDVAPMVDARTWQIMTLQGLR